jgi:hypothetical protein
MKRSLTFMAPNKSLQRYGTHRMMTPGAPALYRRALRSRGATGRRTVAELSRQATYSR